MNCIIFVANRGYALTSSRISIIQRFLSSGWKVVIATADDIESKKLCAMGVHLEPVMFSRGGLAPLDDIKSFKRLFDIYRKWKPVLIHHFHAKPVIFGSIAARRALGSKAVVMNTITGLGHTFTIGGLPSKLAGLGYRFALRHTAAIIFQNRDDRDLFLERGWVTRDQVRLIVSSGVDTNRFSMVDRSGRDHSSPNIVMLARLLNQKGIPEFVEVANNILQRWPKARFFVAGEEDPGHPDSVNLAWIRSQTVVEFLGRISNVASVLATADLFLFPSYYREGVPRVVLEAAAMGLPTVGFEVPGVREAVLDGVTGYLVPARDVGALTNRVVKLLEDRTLCLSMGRAARGLMESDFDKPIIEEQYIQLYRELDFKVI
jgi:glycosyltransferase involved in cell wall biosynthesis